MYHPTLLFTTFFLFLSLTTLAQDARPNIVLIMADDMGFSDIGSYGGEIQTPNLDSLAYGGMRFTQFYNNAKCAPTRASLLTGLYSQQTGLTNGPAVIQNSVTFAEVLKQAGYRTMMVGKWHADELPINRGFERYYGLTDGCCNFFNPGHKRDHEPQPKHKTFPRKWADGHKVSIPMTPKDKDFYTTDAFTDYALQYLDELGSGNAPFILYVAYTAPHYPLHAPQKDIAKYQGTYMKGWDQLRKERYARQIDMGLFNLKTAPLTPRDHRVPDWENVPNKDAWKMDQLRNDSPKGLKWNDAKSQSNWDLKMAVYAAMVDRMDQNIGRILDKLKALNKFNNTLILFLSDNGACAEIVHVTQDIPPGTVNSYRTVDPPWANAQNTPFHSYKRYDYEGGITTPLIAHWPKAIQPGTITHQLGHIIDFMATFIELGKGIYPETYADRSITPLEGKSLKPIFEGKKRKEYDFLYWAFNSSRAVRQGDWKAVQEDGSTWELYNLKKDRTELNNLAQFNPKRTTRLAEKWQEWNKRSKVKQLRKH